VLTDLGCRTFTLQIHDDLLAELTASKMSLRAYLRDRIRRTLKRQYGSGNVPLFFFVEEDRDAQGASVAHHVHGVIELRSLELARVGVPSDRRRFEKIAHRDSLQAAQDAAGLWGIKRALQRAAGLEGWGATSSTGVKQNRRIWLKKPYPPIFNDGWVTYAFKNSGGASLVLNTNRLMLPNELQRDAKHLWSIIRGHKPRVSKPVARVMSPKVIAHPTP